MSTKRWTRRRVLQAASAACAAPLVLPARVLGLDGPGANERVHVGIIGLGGRARDIATTVHATPGIQIVAVCDCFSPRCDKFIQAVSQGQSWTPYDDFRRMIDREKLDAVMIETTTHARAWIAIQAMQAGLDVYIEKPMCLTIAEGRQMVQAARRYERVTQVGTQQRSMPINNWASDLVKQGAIGKVHTVLAPNFIGPDLWTDKPAEAMPGTGSQWWDVWTNQAPLRPYHPDLHFGWARWRDYDAGGLCFGVSGWGTHSYDQVNRALGTDETGPVEVLLEEPVEVRDSGRFAARSTVGGVIVGETGDADTGVDYHAMAHLAGPRAKVSMRFASGTQLKLHLDGDRGPGLGAIFIGDKGKVEINRNRVASNPRELVRSPENPGPNTKPETQYHIENWIECIKTRARCTADIEYGHRATSLCELVNIARQVGRVGQPLHWDPVAEQFSDCDEGNLLLTRERRAGYELPSLS
jgi:predicted dehydrogenase